MAGSLSLLSNQAVELEQSLEGAEIARIISISSFSLLVYEYFITLDEEIKYFWIGRWTPSRILFLLNRYFPPFIVIMVIAGYSIPDPSSNVCKHSIQALFVLNLLVISVIQGILTIRIWYLFQGKKAVQIGIILGFLASFISSSVLLYLSIRFLRIVSPEEIKLFLPNYRNIGCKAARPPQFWRIYLPSLVFHTLVYILTAMRALRNRRLLKEAPILKRLLRDGGFFYFVVFASVGLTAIGSFLDDAPKINIPAIFSPFLLTIISIAVSRVLFSIRSLAEKLGSDSAWLLTNLQLRRVGWRHGAREGEIIVERDTVDVNDLESRNSSTMTLTGSVHSELIKIKETRVGVYDGLPWQ